VVLGNIAMNLVLMRFLEFRSFPLAASITQFLNFAILFLLLRRRTGGLAGRRILSVTLRTLVAAFLSGGIAWLAARAFEHVFSHQGVLRQFAEVAVAGSVGVAAYYLLALALRLTEVRQAFHDLLAPLRHGEPR
jgi:peptidoglycan biosynthesis protein MviN/MurJ (putative lipid II flippase)